MPAISFNLLAERLHGHAFADDFRGRAVFPQPVKLPIHPPLLHGILQRDADLLDRQRLFDKIESAELGGLHRSFDIAVARKS